MDKEFTIALPKLGESIVSATVVQWFKKVGDPISLDEPLLEVSTDKVNSEIPSPVKGVVKQILADVDVELDVGAPLAIISTEEVQASTQAPAPVQQEETSADASNFYSPSVLRLAQEKGLSLDQLAKIKGSGAGGRITKKDLENYSAPCPLKGDQLTGMRKAIADAMVKSSNEIPHATLVGEIDVTELLKVIAKEKEAFLKTHGCKLTITSFVARAIGRAAQEFPTFNATFDGSLIKHASVNVGIAVSLEKGLMVPVIKECQSKSLSEISKSVDDLAGKARTDSLKPDDVQDGTITLTNFGMGGALIGIPIINHPQVAIIGIGAIERRVVAIDDENTAIRKCMFISCTFDHRVIDGMEGCNFLAAFKKHLESDLSID